MFILDGFCEKELVEKRKWFISYWKEVLCTRFVQAPQSFQEDFPDLIEDFVNNKDHGLAHAGDVWILAAQFASLIGEELGNFPKSKIDFLIEEACVFHDAGRFFIPRKNHPRYKEMRESAIKLHHVVGVDLAINLGCRSLIVANAIRCHDFFNKGITPNMKPPDYLIGEVIRAADKMTLSPCEEVDRYWAIGKRVGTPFFLPDISLEERTSPYLFNAKDQLNYFLAMLLLSPEDFCHPVLQKAYKSWEKGKGEAMKRILVIAREDVGLKGKAFQALSHVIDEWKKATNCQW